MNNSYNGPNYSNLGINASGVQGNMTSDNAIYNSSGNADSFRKYALLSVIFSIVYTFCLYKNHSGITYPIFMLVSLVLLHFLRKKDNLSLFKARSGNKALSIFFVVILMFLSIHKCMTTNNKLLILDGIAIFLLFFSFVLYLYVDTTGWDIAGWLEGIVLAVFLPFSHISRPSIDFSAWQKDRSGETDPARRQMVSAILIGIICAIPVLSIVLALLSSADAVFAKVIKTVLEAIKLPDNIWDILGILITLVLAFLGAYLVPFVLEKGEIKIKPAEEGKGNPIIAITFTCILGVVYVLFSLIQVMYLFTGSMELPAGYTYAKYAHEGFYQLLTVSVLNIVIVSVCQRFFKKSKALTIATFIIAACTYIMVVSSAMRMLLYIDVYHLTFMRLFVLWFLVVLCLWLAFLMIGMFSTSFPVFKSSMVAIAVAYSLFIVSNPDYQVARYDIAAAEKGQIDEFNSVREYILDNLSTDAAPALVQHNDILRDFELEIDSRYDEKDYEGLRKHNFSYSRAQKIFENMKIVKEF